MEWPHRLASKFLQGWFEPLKTRTSKTGFLITKPSHEDDHSRHTRASLRKMSYPFKDQSAAQPQMQAWNFRYIGTPLDIEVQEVSFCQVANN